MRTWFIWIVISAMMVSGCSSTLSPQEASQARQNITADVTQLKQSLSQHVPDIQQQTAQSYAYLATFMSRFKAPIVGAGKGIGVIYNNQTHTTTYVNINRFDLGAGLAYGHYQALTLFANEQELQEFLDGGYKAGFTNETHGLDNDEVGEGSYQIAGDWPYKTYVYHVDDQAVVGTYQFRTLSINKELTQTAVGEARVANKVNKDNEREALQWHRALPFFAQDVVDKGYDLPNPYGVSLIYAETKQTMTITELEAGFSFWDRGRIPMMFVTFDNNSSHSRSPQLKVDAWLFPFMNLFASVGKVSGTAHIEFELDGNDLIDQIGLECKPFPPQPLCQKLYDFLKDGSVHVPLDVDLDGYNYTLGTVLAAGWNDFFIAVPVSFSYIEMDKANAQELVLNASARIGKQFSWSRGHSIDGYIGASYLDSDLTLIGKHYLPVGEPNEYIDYKIRQENIDKWMMLVGANYNFNKVWSISAEIGYKSSDKQQFISSLNYRF
ncbi:hypothetical protein [Paraferrimonas haliotis]|uniref:hypothetical protein n=1 Tax=Paraferrimonas haliotis TaxID=2013866 RepID=UPI000F76BB9E|nr:hypothetical protein [Paraferrimonas haliotis]